MGPLLRGVLAGALGGVAGTLAMNVAQRAWTHLADDAPPDSAAGLHDARDWQERVEHENSNELAAQAVARLMLGRELTEQELAIAAPAIHFTFGAAVGALYGAFARGEARAWKSGAALGAALWLTADEVAMPLLGLSHPTHRRPLEMHLQSLGSHLVYGTVVERVRQASGNFLHENARATRI